MTTATDIEVVDLAVTPLRELNQRLHDAKNGNGPKSWKIVNPNGAHALAVEEPRVARQALQRARLHRGQEHARVGQAVEAAVDGAPGRGEVNG